MLLLLFLAPLAFSRRHRHRRSRRNRILDSMNADAENLLPSPKTDGDRFVLLSTILDKPSTFGLTWGEARTLLLLSALNRQNQK